MLAVNYIYYVMLRSYGSVACSIDLYNDGCHYMFAGGKIFANTEMDSNIV